MLGCAPSLCLSPGGGEIGKGSLSVGGGEIGGRFETCPYRCWVGWGEIEVGVLRELVIVGSGGGTPSLCLSPGGGEIGMGSLSLSGGEIGIGRSSVGGGEIGGRFETCPYRCWVG